MRYFTGLMLSSVLMATTASKTEAQFSISVGNGFGYPGYGISPYGMGVPAYGGYAPAYGLGYNNVYSPGYLGNTNSFVYSSGYQGFAPRMNGFGYGGRPDYRGYGYGGGGGFRPFGGFRGVFRR